MVYLICGEGGGLFEALPVWSAVAASRPWLSLLFCNENDTVLVSLAGLIVRAILTMGLIEILSLELELALDALLTRLFTLRGLSMLPSEYGASLIELTTRILGISLSVNTCEDLLVDIVKTGSLIKANDSVNEIKSDAVEFLLTVMLS